MTINLALAEVYDEECLPNIFTFAIEQLFGDVKAVWEISEFRDDRVELFEHLRYLNQNQIPMIGFNNINYDYPLLHLLWTNPNATYQQLYQKSQEILNSGNVPGGNRFGHIIWDKNRFTPQIDLFKIHHFDNKAKSTGLKTLQINMRCEEVIESRLPFDRPITIHERDSDLIPYTLSDVAKTKLFAHHSMTAIEFRIGMIPQFGIDVMNWNETKIGEQMVIQRLGDDVCYDRSTGRKQPRLTARSRVALGEIIFPYVHFQHPEFNRIKDYISQQVLTADDWRGDDDGTPNLTTKGVFTDLVANINGLEYHYGVGGIHGSVERKRIVATDEWLIRDIDVAALYPNIAIQNGLHPAHLGQRFVEIYSGLPKERKRWQTEKGKKCVEANALKLASNGVYGKSNSIYSPFYDPQFMLQITVNGQLMLSMLAERLMAIPTVQILMINTDGITYYIHRDHLNAALSVEKEWEALTKLTLEDTNYKAMFIRDVNNYLAISLDGSAKTKGAYWTPDPLDYMKSIAESQPAAFHKNFSNIVSTRAAVAYMTQGVDMASFIRLNTNPYDFCCAVKVRRADTLLWNNIEQQRNTRFYVSTDGAGMIKRLPSQGTPGAFKKANGVGDEEYLRVMRETGGAWDARVCTKNRSVYEIRDQSIMAGYNVRICNNIKDFDWTKINYDWYLQEAQKLVI